MLVVIDILGNEQTIELCTETDEQSNDEHNDNITIDLPVPMLQIVQIHN